MNNDFPVDVDNLQGSIEELATLYQAGYIKDGRDIDQNLLDEVINSRQDNE